MTWEEVSGLWMTWEEGLGARVVDDLGSGIRGQGCGRVWGRA